MADETALTPAIKLARARSGWSTGGRSWSLKLVVGVVMAIGLGLCAVVTWADAVRLTRSPLCGPSCQDPEVVAALIATEAEFPRRLRPALAASAAQLRLAPFDTGAWLRLSMLQIRAGGGGMTTAAASTLLTSYGRAPVDASVASWRIPLVFSYWPSAPPRLRLAAVREVRVLYAAAENRQVMRGYLGRIRSHQGRFAYQLLIENLDELDYRAEGRETPSPIPKAKVQSPATPGN